MTASLFSILQSGIIRAFSGQLREEEKKDDRHAETFLAVVDHFPFLNKARVFVCEVTSFGVATSFSDQLERLVGGRMKVLRPMWETEDFYRLDRHLTPAGHRRLAREIAAALAEH
ncbi:MAG: hypothetical protein ACK4VP_09315 [Nitrospira sp.]